MKWQSIPRSVHQPNNTTGNLNTTLATELGDARLGCMEHNFWNINTVLPTPLNCKLSVSVSHWSFWMNRFEWITERCLGFHGTCNLWRTSVSAFTNSTDTHTFCNCLWMFVNDFFFCRKKFINACCFTHITLPRHFDVPYERARKRSVHSTARASGTFITCNRENCSHFLLFCMKYREVMQKVLGNCRAC